MMYKIHTTCSSCSGGRSCFYFITVSSWFEAALSEVIREEGLLGMYRGWGASCLKVMPNSGITWMFYEAWKDMLLADRDEPRPRDELL